MDAPKRTSRRSSPRFKYLFVALVVIIVVVLLAIIIPLTVLPKERLSKGFRSNVLVPLYIYPAVNAWNPLYDAIINHSAQNFTIILNPNSGPGPSPYPSDDYTSQIQRLNTFPNVQTLGYVHTSYAQRDIQSVLKDISTYSGWAQGSANANMPGFAVHGIFVDEIPSVYSPEAAEYLQTINAAIKKAPGLLGNKLTVHNPGRIPDSRFADNNTDTTVVFEETYQVFHSKESELAGLSQKRSRNSYVIHSLPTNMSKEDLRSLLARSSQHAGFLFVTNLDQNYFENFGSLWSTFIDAMPT